MATTDEKPALSTAHNIVQQAAFPTPRVPPFPALRALAEAYIAVASGGGETLGEAGAVFVTLGAARAYGAVERIADDEEARRELTEILWTARQRADGSWRSRTRARGLDVTARVKWSGRLALVEHVSVREANIDERDRRRK